MAPHSARPREEPARMTTLSARPREDLARVAPHSPLVPANAGTQSKIFRLSFWPWTPAFAGVSGEVVVGKSTDPTPSRETFGPHSSTHSAHSRETFGPHGPTLSAHSRASGNPEILIQTQQQPALDPRFRGGERKIGTRGITHPAHSRETFGPHDPHSPLIPAQAGIQKHQFRLSNKPPWTPASAGVSGEVVVGKSTDPTPSRETFGPHGPTLSAHSRASGNPEILIQTQQQPALDPRVRGGERM